MSCDLHPLVSSRIEILGLTPRELTNYFTECLGGDSKAVEILFERINENPAIAGSCYLPMNASILVHLFESGNKTLPTTQYGIFSELVLCCIYRHHNERTHFKNLTLESLQQIPKALRKPFRFLCELAYQGIMDDRVIFSLPADVNTLGLLQGVESFVKRHKAVSYNFLHISIQELLAGLYIATHLPDDEQATKFNELFDKSRFSAVFQFYAAITKLHTCDIKDVVVRVAKQSSNKTLLLSLLHCLYEAQDSSLCASVALQLEHGLNLSFTTLTQSDCFCIGYFLSHVCKMATGKFEVNLESCSIGDQGCKYLVRCFDKTLSAHSEVTTLLSVNLSFNCISHSGALHLSTLLKLGCTENFGLGSESASLLQKIQGHNLKTNLGSLQGIAINVVTACIDYEPNIK